MNREEWLNLVAEQMAPWFEAQGHKLPRYRVAIGFPSTGKRGKRSGECWDGQVKAAFMPSPSNAVKSSCQVSALARDQCTRADPARLQAR
jgi:hypothetical protein